MRATRSDSLVLDKCRLGEDAVVYQSGDVSDFRRTTRTWACGSYTAVYLGVACAIFSELVRVVRARQVPGYAQSLAYHPDVRRQIAQLSAELEAARLVTYRSAWLYDTEGPTAETTAALFRAKYIVGEAVAHIARVALTISGSHGIFKGERIEQLYRDGALGPLHAPPSDFCLWNMDIGSRLAGLSRGFQPIRLVDIPPDLRCGTLADQPGRLPCPWAPLGFSRVTK